MFVTANIRDQIVADFFVEASAPKNSARMSLSIPITRAPSPAKRLTVSEPISPAEPVTMIVRGVLTTVVGSCQHYMRNNLSS